MAKHLVKFPCRPISVSTFTFLVKTFLINTLELYRCMQNDMNLSTRIDESSYSIIIIESWKCVLLKLIPMLMIVLMINGNKGKCR